ncbi:predicted protein [Nematostella vectensis]|uniref:FAS1 domain-containing protein n=1 Tax=Nematostella vectensis TaxID=45351 RepID=A7RJ38_NEMVE|nr:predicted protein [Nematostella vectensis]|eukprot:XP_001640571.1 predicted protein [Nematostella vectensis]
MAMKLALACCLFLGLLGLSSGYGPGWMRLIGWWKRHHQERRLPEQPDIHQPLKKDGLNVCEMRVPVGMSQECVLEQGLRRLKCRSVTHHRTDYVCCPGFARVKGKPGCPEELYVSKMNIVEVAKSLGLSEFVKLVNLAELGSELVLDTKYTAFIPSNEAIKSIPAKTLEALAADPKKLRDVLLFHVLPEKVVSEALKHNMLLQTMDPPNDIRVNVNERTHPQVKVVQGAKIIQANQGASNGIIHVIDRVIFPSSGNLMSYLNENPQLSMLYEVLNSRNMTLSNVTLFAPSNAALQSLPPGRLDKLLKNKQCLQKFLTYHVLPEPLYSPVLRTCRWKSLEGSFVGVMYGADNTSLEVNDAMVTIGDVSTTDGVIHVIDKPLMPYGAMDLVEAVKSLKLNTLAKLLEDSGLAKTLATIDTSFTLLAPTDKAFSAVPADVMADLSRDAEKLKKVLTYHVIGRRVWTYEFGRDTLVDSLEGTKLRLNTFRLGKLHSVNGACLSRSNLETCNSVIHVISSVLIPEQRTLYDIVRNEPQFTTLARILEKSSLSDMLKNSSRSITLFAPTNKEDSEEQRQQGLF